LEVPLPEKFRKSSGKVAVGSRRMVPEGGGEQGSHQQLYHDEGV